MDKVQLAADIRRVRSNMKKRKQRSVNSLNLSQWCMQTAVCIALLLNSDFSAAADWLYCPIRRGKKLPPRTRFEEVRTAVEEYYTAMSPCQFAHLTSLQSPPLDASMLRTAHTWCT